MLSKSTSPTRGNVRAAVAKNLRQLLEWVDVGNDRDGRKETANFQLLKDICCLQHNYTRELVPVVSASIL